MVGKVENGVIQLGEHSWQLPNKPLTQDEVLFVHDRKEDQYWRRLKNYPKYFFDWDSETELFADHTIYGDAQELISLNRQDSKNLLRLRDQELRRRVEGVWFMNYGELTYLTGGHYFMLQWGALMEYFDPETGEPYGKYYEYQRDVHYSLKMCKDDRNCKGEYIVKPKKTGITQLLALDFLDESTRMRGKWFGIMSKSQLDARNTNLQMYKYAFEKMPEIMKPSIANENLSMIFYGNPVNNKNKSRKNSKKNNGNLDWLNTRVTALPTKDNAFDGAKPFRAWTDELPKCEDPYPEAIIEKTGPTVKMQNEITGKWWVSSYTPEKDNKGCKQTREFYYDSKLKTLNPETGRTKSEMYVHFIDVRDSAQGTFDKYGRADRRATQVFINVETEARKNNPAALQAFQRVNPTSEEEAWRPGGGGNSSFDNLRLGVKLMKLEDNLRVGDLPFEEWDIKWTGERLNSPVVLVPITDEQRKKGYHGFIRTYGRDKWREGTLNQIVNGNLKDNTGKWKLPDTIRNVAALDPTNYAHAKLVTKGSLNALWVMNLPDAELNALQGAQVSNMPIFRYKHRHEKPQDTYEDILKIIFLFGCPIAVEGNMGWVLTKLVEDDLGAFVLVQDKTLKTIEPYNPAKHQKMITATKSGKVDTLSEYIRIFKNWMTPGVDEFDNLENLNDEDAVQELMDFDPDDTTEFDTAMALLLVVYVAVCYMAIQKRREENKKVYDPMAMARAMASLMD